MIDDIPYDGCIYWYVSYIDDLHMLVDDILCFTLHVSRMFLGVTFLLCL